MIMALGLRTQGTWQWHPRKPNKNTQSIGFLFVKSTVLCPANVSFDNTLFTVVRVKGQHLKGTHAHLTASVYTQTAAGKRSNSCGTWNELFRIQFWVDPSWTSVRRRNLSTLLVGKLRVAPFAWLIPPSWDQEWIFLTWWINQLNCLVNKLRKPSVQVQYATERHSVASVCDRPWSLMPALSLIWHCLPPPSFQAKKFSKGGRCSERHRNRKTGQLPTVSCHCRETV